MPKQALHAHPCMPYLFAGCQPWRSKVAAGSRVWGRCWLHCPSAQALVLSSAPPWAATLVRPLYITRCMQPSLSRQQLSASGARSPARHRRTSTHAARRGAGIATSNMGQALRHVGRIARLRSSWIIEVGSFSALKTARATRLGGCCQLCSARTPALTFKRQQSLFLKAYAAASKLPSCALPRRFNLC